MATYRKRGDSWRVELYVNGVRRSATRETKAQAKAWAAETEAAIRAGEEKEEPKHTLREALTRYAEEVTPSKRGARWELLRINAFINELSFIDRNLSEITTPQWAKWRNKRLAQVSPGTVSREMTIIKGMYSVARREWHWVKDCPLNDVRRPPNPPSRDRRVPDHEVQAMCAALGYADDLPITSKRQQVAVAFLLGLETAMRCGEILGMCWTDINQAKRFVVLPKTKNGSTREVPLSNRALALLDKLQGIDPIKCFTVASASTDRLFRVARDRAAASMPEISTLHFHDSRHEAITRLARSGKLSVLQLARMVGHRNLKSLQIYYNETATELAALLD